MPFHLEKGHAMLALDDLFNNPQHGDTLQQLHQGLGAGTPLGELFAVALNSAPNMSSYAGASQPVTDAGGLGPFVSGAWFGQVDRPADIPPSADWEPPTTDYWIDYSGDVDEIIRQTMLFAVEVAWGIAPDEPLIKPASPRRIEFWWHCAQRWFDAWVSWQNADDAIRILFATPVHTYGTVYSSVITAENTSTGAGGERTEATRVTPADTDPNADMVLITHERHQARLQWSFKPASAAYPGITLSGLGAIPIPAVGLHFDGEDAVDAWRIDRNAGGIQPLSNTGWR
ncbi:MAG: hypothetical protein AAGF73_15010 [Actinomycetota bacterium]